MFNSVRPHRRQPNRLPHPWDSPGKNTGVGCHFLLQCMKVKSEREVAQSCPTLCDPMDCSLPGSSVHGIFQARVLERGAIAFSVIASPLRRLQNQEITNSPGRFYRSLLCHWAQQGNPHSWPRERRWKRHIKEQSKSWEPLASSRVNSDQTIFASHWVIIFFFLLKGIHEFLK